MENAQRVVADIVARCQYRGVEVSETLAAFIARLVVHRSQRHLVLEQPMSPQDELYLTEQCEKALLRNDDPAMETVKMQLEFDFTYANLEEELRTRKERKEQAVVKLQRTISSLVPEKATDFETLSTLYKHIFTLLMLDADGLSRSNNINDDDDGENTCKGKSNCSSKQEQAERRSMEKEVAAALESVFPRIGLKSFATMSPDDKRFQLDELMRIVEGIRLFNKELGKGGAGIAASARDIQESVAALAKLVRDEVRDANEICTQYTEVLLHVHHQLGTGEEAHSAEPSPSLDEIARWQDELSNRRQFLSYLQSLEEDIAFSHEKVGTRLQMFQADMSALQNLVGARTSLPKSHVYPLFEAVSHSWAELHQEHELLQARARALRSLLRFKSTFTRTLSSESPIVRQARRGGSIPPEDLFSHVETFPVESQLAVDGKTRSFGLEGEDLDGDEDNSNPSEEEGSGFPIRMPVESTPEFMQLPLDYQGFCPWTVVERGGLLLPGDPSLGVVQYRNAYHVFVNERALGEFMIHPRRYVQGVLRRAGRQPALIYLLRLQESFPNITLSSLLKMCHRYRAEGARGMHLLLAPLPSQKVDASTATPTHFMEKRIDYNYDWNEWNLRRKAIKIANLRHCRTVGAQTALSSFRREVDTQVYLPGDLSCQTSKTKGTNPSRDTTYFTGLRKGHLYSIDDAKRAEAKEAKVSGTDYRKNRRSKHNEVDAKDGKAIEEDDNQPVVVSYTFELS
ncbi:hypothetical protein GN244_ATG19082 [Phytophthora infestans]|uniref:Cilia- and flagella-associated protein 206 n=1 Tax=Phytophthora infestans TaxID=4787 RepID=A0A833SVI6_PHYIN|nr:hypothetical protein GN244_ATG19082 [Phytophthora infestans]KAI9987251.1 hypothetical protein PInf_023224 [Phytophthora infestans]KAI9987314.1 hypothetical protein PInf_023317 [Phytophthora infestans]